MSPPKVVVCEDDALIRAFIVYVLTDAGYITLEASDAELAQALVLADANVDLIITDISLPGMSGIQFAQWVRQNRPSIKVVICSGYYANEDHEISSLADAYLQKPIVPDAILTTVYKLAPMPSGHAERFLYVNGEAAE